MKTIPDSVVVNVRLVGLSPKAILVAANGQGKGIWLADRFISHDEDVCIGDLVDVTMPRWLAKDRELL